MPTTQEYQPLPQPRLFAVIPAAGLSRRMGRPKLILDLGGRSVLARLVDALCVPEVAGRFIVIRKDDVLLREHAESLTDLTIVTPEMDPPDMRTSVSIALQAIREQCAPCTEDGWLLVPADHPCLNQQVLNRLIATWHAERPTILVPTHSGKRGHPTLFRWSLADEVDRLPEDCGLNTLVHARSAEVCDLDSADPGILTDLDTPADYEQLQRKFNSETDSHPR